MTAKPLFPLHDDQGFLFPEVDWRWVSSTVMRAYEGRCLFTVYTRTVKGWYGKIGSTLVRHRPMPDGKTSRIFEYLPAAIWRAHRWGRFADPSFDPQAHRRLWECDPKITAERRDRPAQVAIPSDFSQALVHLTNAHMQTLALLRQCAPGITVVARPIPFTAQGR